MQYLPFNFWKGMKIMMTSRELVYAALENGSPERAPRDMWLLPWASKKYPNEVQKIAEAFPGDFGGVRVDYEKLPVTVGDPYTIGKHVDMWGCEFDNIQEGVIGEVKNPIITVEDEEWDGTDKIHIPYELLTFDVSQVNAGCAKSDKFISCGCCPRPFEQLQFIRGTENLYMDLMDPPPKMLEFMNKMHEFYCELLNKWAKTDVDCLNYMDDWGSQKSLLINPKLWVKYFKPMYKDYIDIAHSHGKKIFMHSDGFTLDIYPHLIELGLDAFNSQIFCIGIDNLAQFKGKITFWGEIDRQNLLPNGTEEEIRAAVRKVYDTLWDNGGCIAEMEFGPGARPENVYAAFDEWDKVTRRS